MKITGEKGVIAHFIRDCEVRPLSPYTLGYYRHDLALLAHLLDVLCGVTDLEQVTVLHLRECLSCLLKSPLASVASEYSKSTSVLDVNSVRAHVRVWKAFFGWCYREELLVRNPADRRLALPKATKKVVETFTGEHIRKMLDSCDLSTQEGFRDYVILLLLLDTGMRLSEIGGLRLDDFHDSYIKVLGKGRKEREIGLYPEVSKLVWRYIHKFRTPANPDESSLFLSCGPRNRGQAFRSGGVASLLRRIKRVTGLDAGADVRLSAHTFRHTHSKMYMEQGGDVLSLSRELGHSDISITEEYLKQFGSQEARKAHTPHSPIKGLNLRKQQKRRER